MGIVFLNLVSLYFYKADSLLLFYIVLISVFLLPGYFTLRESPLWLLRRGMYRQTATVLKDIARLNGKGRTVDTTIMDLEDELENSRLETDGYDDGQDKLSISQRLRLIFDDNNNLKSLIILSGVSCAQYCMYYGISTSIQDLGFDRI